MTDTVYDLMIIGGGINGCGIARDAAGRGLKVLLAEQSDLAQGTSSASSKLIHGGLRYLEYYEFRLVREALTEREILLTNAPHIIWPLRFVLPHHNALRPAWLLRLGLFIYDHLGGRKRLPATQSLNLHTHETGQVLHDTFRKGFEYSDCWVDDARLVVLNALDAKRRGAEILTRTQCVAAQRENGLWHVTLEDHQQGTTQTIKARALINAAGPWVDQLLNQTQLKDQDKSNVRLVRGSHIIVKKLFTHDRAYIFQNNDQRIVFVIPYEEDFTLIGTTDRDHQASLDKVSIAEDEIEYLCRTTGEYFKQTITPADVVWSYSGVRHLFDDGADAAQSATRDYVLKVEDEMGAAPLLNIFGGKITTYRCLAQDALEKLAPFFDDVAEGWTHDTPLPGGEFDLDERDAKIQQLQQDYPFLDATWSQSLMRRYGQRAWDMLGNAGQLEDLGQQFGAYLTEQEIKFLVQEEWAQTAEDILWRRSKLGLHMTPEQRLAVEKHINTGEKPT